MDELAIIYHWHCCELWLSVVAINNKKTLLSTMNLNELKYIVSNRFIPLCHVGSCIISLWDIKQLMYTQFRQATLIITLLNNADA